MAIKRVKRGKKEKIGKKVLVAYYSRTGSNKLVAEAIARKLKADIDEIISLKNYSGLIGWIRAGYNASKEKQVMINTQENPESYDLVIVGSPNWAGKMANPMLSYLSKNKFKKIAFFSVCGSGQPQKTPKQLKDRNLDPISMLFLKEKEVKDGTYHKKITDFCKNLK